MRKGTRLRRIVFCLFSGHDLAVYERHFRQLAATGPGLAALDTPCRRLATCHMTGRSHRSLA